MYSGCMQHLHVHMCDTFISSNPNLFNLRVRLIETPIPEICTFANFVNYMQSQREVMRIRV